MSMDAPTMDVLRKQAIAMAMLWFTARDYDTQGGHAWFHIHARDLGLKDSVLPGMKIVVRIECEPDTSGVQGTSGDQPASPADQAIYKGMADRYQRERTPGVLVVDQRQRFEAWADDQGFPLKKLETSDGYLDLRTEGAWEAWQAALALGVKAAEEAQPRNVTAQEDKWLRDAANRSAKVVAPGKLAAGVTVGQPAHSKSEYKRRVALGDPNVAPPAPAAATACQWPDCGCYAIQGPGWCKRNAGVEGRRNG